MYMSHPIANAQSLMLMFMFDQQSLLLSVLCFPRAKGVRSMGA
jgi:hypothetical protein